METVLLMGEKNDFIDICVTVPYLSFCMPSNHSQICRTLQVNICSPCNMFLIVLFAHKCQMSLGTVKASKLDFYPQRHVTTCKIMLKNFLLFRTKINLLLFQNLIHLYSFALLCIYEKCAICPLRINNWRRKTMRVGGLILSPILCKCK